MKMIAQSASKRIDVEPARGRSAAIVERKELYFKAARRVAAVGGIRRQHRFENSRA